MKPEVKQIVDDAVAWVEQKRQEGWTQEDFARALREFFEQENANARAAGSAANETNNS